MAIAACVAHDTSERPHPAVDGDPHRAGGDGKRPRPPGDIHRVTNSGATAGVSLHVYSTDIGRIGNSVRRTYDLPIVEPNKIRSCPPQRPRRASTPRSPRGREGARRMLVAALKAEVDEYVGQHADHRDEGGHALVVQRRGRAADGGHGRGRAGGPGTTCARPPRGPSVHQRHSSAVGATLAQSHRSAAGDPTCVGSRPRTSSFGRVLRQRGRPRRVDDPAPDAGVKPGTGGVSLRALITSSSSPPAT